MRSARGITVYFGRHADGVLENEFSGNLVEVCPTGVFTDKTLKRHYTRKWDHADGAVGLRALRLGLQHNPGERYGMLRRIVNRYNRRSQWLLPLRPWAVWL